MLIIVFADHEPIIAAEYSGSVYDAVELNAIEGAVVTIGWDSYPPDPISFTDTTDWLGRFDFIVQDGLAFSIVVTMPGYISFVMKDQQPDHYIILMNKPESGFLVETLYEGLQNYKFNGLYCYLDSGIVSYDDYFFPDINAQSDTIDMFLEEIGTGIEPTVDDSLVWLKCTTLWYFLDNHASGGPPDSLYQVADDFMHGGVGWPSIDRISRTYYRYGMIPWGICTDKAIIFTTILHRLGILKNRLAVAYCRYNIGSYDHYYPMLYFANRWLYFDPQYCTVPFPDYDDFSSFPYGWYIADPIPDYCHPFGVLAIPGSTITEVPEINNRSDNSRLISINLPCTRIHTMGSLLTVRGIVADTTVTEVFLNEVSHPVDNGTFTCITPLMTDINPVIAKISINNHEYSDQIDVYKDCFFEPEQQLNIPASWSGVSSYVFPCYTLLETMLFPIEDQVYILRTIDQFYSPVQTYNTLLYWAPDQGYLIKTFDSVDLDIYGIPSEDRTVEFNMDHNGWNILPVLSESDYNRSYVTEALGDTVTIIKEIGGNGYYWTSFSWNLYQLETGKAYFIKVTNPCSYTFIDSKKSSENVKPDRDIVENPWNDVIKTGYSHLIAIDHSAFETTPEIQPGMMFGCFTQEGLCAGYATYDPQTSYTVLVAFGDDEMTDTISEGFTENESFTFRAYSSENQQEYSLTPVFDTQTPDFSTVYSMNGLSVIRGIALSPYSIEDQLLASRITVFPNPSDGNTHLVITGSYRDLNIIVWNTWGDQIYNTQMSPKTGETKIDIDLSGFPAGIYFLTAFDDQATECQKIVIY